MSNTTNLNNLESTNFTIGNSVPKDFFITKGTGQSDIAIHSGSFLYAMQKAGIESCNILSYQSSMLPRIAKQIEQPNDFEPGTVIHAIMAVCNARRGQRATAGIKFGWLIDKKTRRRYSGLVFSNWGYYTVEDLESMLNESLIEVFENCYQDKYELSDIETVVESFVPNKTNGTAVVALCFYNYLRTGEITNE